MQLLLWKHYCDILFSLHSQGRNDVNNPRSGRFVMCLLAGIRTQGQKTKQSWALFWSDMSNIAHQTRAYVYSPAYFVCFVRNVPYDAPFVFTFLSLSWWRISTTGPWRVQIRTCDQCGEPRQLPKTLGPPTRGCFPLPHLAQMQLPPARAQKIMQKSVLSSEVVW